VAIYLRRSTDDEHQPFSISAQDSALGKYVTTQPGWTLVAKYTDDASGATTERPGLQQVLRAARAGRFDVLLVYRVDRFSRRLSDLLGLLNELEEAGVALPYGFHVDRETHTLVPQPQEAPHLRRSSACSWRNASAPGRSRTS
jgi:DNA invertase Pin-like site-specific DNA recombinase